MNYKLKKFIVSSLILVVFTVIFIQFIQQSSVSAEEKEVIQFNKYYKSYVVKSGDTVWDIACIQIQDTDLDAKLCVKDIIESNQLPPSGYIKEGELIIIPCYSADFIELNELPELCEN